jgi:ABC-type Fe3+ transport system permease subunit
MTSVTTHRQVPRKPIDWWRWAGRVFLLFMLLFTLLPMVWMVLTSIKTQFAAFQYPPQWWPKEPTLDNYVKLLNPFGAVGQEFLQYLWNSIFVSLCSTVLGVVVAVPAAYAFSRFRFPGRQFLFFSVLLRNMFPSVIFLMPLFLLMRWLGLINNPGSLILTYLTFGRHAAEFTRHYRDGDLLVHPRLERICLCAHLPQLQGKADPADRAPALLHRICDRLAGADGGFLHHERTGGGDVPDPAEILRARAHRRRGQTLRGGKWLKLCSTMWSRITARSSP